MNAIIDFYAQEAQKNRSHFPWLAQLQEQAFLKFEQQGFPNRHVEDWKYTSLNRFQELKFFTANSKGLPLVSPQLPIPQQVSIYNGQVYFSETTRSSLQASVIFTSLSEALAKNAEKLVPFLPKEASNEGFAALNLACLTSGLLLVIPKNTHLEAPILINYYQDNEQQAVYNRLFIHVEEGASATVIEYFHGQKDLLYCTNTYTDALLEKNSSLTHYKIQQESKAAYHLGHLAVRQGLNSEMISHSISLGGHLVRSDTHIRLEEEHAHSIMNGVYFPLANQHMDHHSCVRHLAAHCQSQQDYKGVIAKKGRAVFDGKVIVAREAQKTEARQQNKNLLLDKEAEIDTKPQLEIDADDVSCSHGATVGQIDEEALFYLLTRGVGRQEALRFLIQGFAADNLAQFAHAPMTSWIQELMDQQLEDCHV